ncbi:hypothetical protein NBRC116493_12690 [Aurantivibrio infirmus]
MMRLMFCFVRRAEISSSDFRNYWRSQEHKEKIDSLVDLFQPTRYADTLSIHLPDLEERFRQNMGRGTQYDAVIEFYWDDEEIVRERIADNAIARIMKVLKDQSTKRVDPDKTTIYLTEIPDVIDNENAKTITPMDFSTDKIRSHSH